MQNVVVAAVAVVALGATGLAFARYQDGSHATGVETRPGAPSAAPGRSTDDAGATTTMPDRSGGTATTARPSQPVRPEQTWLDALAKPGAQLLVVGDRTVNDRDEWVVEWAALQGGRPIDVLFWQEESGASYEGRLRVGDEESPGADLTIWDAGREDTTVAQAADRVGSFVEQGAVPDVVLVTVTDGDREDFDALASELQEAAGESVPTLVVLSPARWAPADEVRVLAAWADDQKVPVIDLRASTDSPIPTPREAAQAVQERLEGWREE